jgi:hypothetical protein
MNSSIEDRIAQIDWQSVDHSLTDYGYARTGPLLTAAECSELRSLYAEDKHFRSKIVMERYRFGKGDYKYFHYPLPKIVENLRTAIYPRLAETANRWRHALEEKGSDFPTKHAEFLERCHRAGQKQATPLLLHYETGGYNCLHQDLYGEIAFPLQLVVMLGQQGRDWDGGEFILVENVPRAQSRAEVITADEGHGIVFTTRYRPVKGARGWYRTAMRHGVSRITRGTRNTLGVIFHDAK